MTAQAPPAPATGRLARWAGPLYGLAVAAACLTLMLGAGYLRGQLLWPREAGLRESPYDDEGVYAAAAQLIEQRKHPYRDFFYAHPPLGPLFYIPAIERHFTTWGSPTSFILARYTAVVYGALTAGLLLLLSWRLWGLPGGILSALLFALDPWSVWVGRHIMLEGPLLLLTVAAILLYVLAQETADEPAFALTFALAGFCAAVAGGIKLQGLVVLAAVLLDLLARRQWWQATQTLAGAFLCWLPLWGYLLYLRQDNPLAQIIWFQLLRPSDGILDLGGRLRLIVGDGRLALWGAALALPALATFAFLHPLTPLQRLARRKRRTRASTAVQLKRLPDLHQEPEAELDDAAVTAPPPSPPATPEPPQPVPAAPAPLELPRDDERGLQPGWTVLLWWLALVTLLLIASRSFYAHYMTQLTLPLAALAGALPAGVWRAARSGWNGRVASLVLVAGAVALLLPPAYGAFQADRRSHPDRIYEIVSRYVGDAAKPDQVVFSLDAQYPFRAARRAAREDRDRFIVDGYGVLLYHGLGIDEKPMLELLGRVLNRPSLTDPYTVMWQPNAQEQLRESIMRSDLVVIDAVSDGRLTDETRRWLARQGTLAVRQERYAIYRITR